MRKTLVVALFVGVLVFVVGALADFYDTYSRTAYALGVVTASLAYLVGSWMEKQ